MALGFGQAAGAAFLLLAFVVVSVPAQTTTTAPNTCRWVNVTGACTASCGGGTRVVSAGCRCGNATQALSTCALFLNSSAPANRVENCSTLACPTCNKIQLYRRTAAAPGAPVNALLDRYSQMVGVQLSGRNVFVGDTNGLVLFHYSVNNNPTAWVIGTNLVDTNLDNAKAINSRVVQLAEQLTSGWAVVVQGPGGSFVQGDSQLNVTCRGCGGPWVYDETTEQCKACHASCATCSGTRQDECTSCPVGMTLAQGFCFDPLEMEIGSRATTFNRVAFTNTLATALVSYFPDDTLTVTVTDVAPTADGFRSIINITVCYPDWCHLESDVLDALSDPTRRAIIETLLGYEYVLGNEVPEGSGKTSSSLDKMIPAIGACGGIVVVVLLIVFYNAACTSKDSPLELRPVQEDVEIGLGKSLTYDHTVNFKPAISSAPYELAYGGTEEPRTPGVGAQQEKSSDYFFIRFLRQQSTRQPRIRQPSLESSHMWH